MEKEVLKKLNEIQQKLKAPKNQYNKFGKYNYRNCEDILEAVKPLLGEAVLIICDEIKNIGDRYYVEATATLSIGDQSISNTASAREADVLTGMQASQITGATSSYARKYALNGLFLIDDTRDADTMDNTGKKEVDIEKIKKELSEIKDIETLRKYHTKNSGLGKEVANLIVERSKEIKSEIPIV